MSFVTKETLRQYRIFSERLKPFDDARYSSNRFQRENPLLYKFFSQGLKLDGETLRKMGTDRESVGNVLAGAIMAYDLLRDQKVKDESIKKHS